MNMKEQMTRRIPAYSREAVDEKLAKLVKKAVRLGCPAPTWHYSDKIEIPMWRIDPMSAQIMAIETGHSYTVTSSPQMGYDGKPRDPDYFEVEYDLTELGRAFLEPVTALCRWATDHPDELATVRLNRKKARRRK